MDYFGADLGGERNSIPGGLKDSYLLGSIKSEEVDNLMHFEDREQKSSEATVMIGGSSEELAAMTDEKEIDAITEAEDEESKDESSSLGAESDPYLDPKKLSNMFTEDQSRLASS